MFIQVGCCHAVEQLQDRLQIGQPNAVGLKNNEVLRIKVLPDVCLVIGIDRVIWLWGLNVQSLNRAYQLGIPAQDSKVRGEITLRFLTGPLQVWGTVKQINGVVPYEIDKQCDCLLEFEYR